MVSMLRFVFAAALVVLSGLAVEAKPIQKTKYKFYNISGDTAAEIYGAMIKRGPDVNGLNAYASTLANSSQSGRLIQGKDCRIDSYQFKIDFTINLPKLKNENALKGATKARWNQFEGFLKQHEEQHKIIWLGCAKELESQVKAIRTTDCQKADKEASRLWDRMRKSCQKKHDAFDKAEQSRLLKHPFVALVFGNRSLKIKKK
jgi:predicted secreted Zn-dependent protease